MGDRSPYNQRSKDSLFGTLEEEDEDEDATGRTGTTGSGSPKRQLASQSQSQSRNFGQVAAAVVSPSAKAVNQSSRAASFTRTGESNFGDDSESQSATTLTQMTKINPQMQGGAAGSPGRSRHEMKGLVDFRTELLDKQSFVQKLNPMIRVARGTTATAGANRRGSLDSGFASGPSPGGLARRGSFSGALPSLGPGSSPARRGSLGNLNNVDAMMTPGKMSTGSKEVPGSIAASQRSTFNGLPTDGSLNLDAMSAANSEVASLKTLGEREAKSVSRSPAR